VGSRSIYGMNARQAVDVAEEIFREIGPGMRDTAAAAEALGLSERTLQDYRLRGVGPRFIRISGKAVRYRARELARWLAEREVQSTSEPTPASSSNPTHRANRDRGGGGGRRA
jgi:hypothetical protein